MHITDDNRTPTIPKVMICEWMNTKIANEMSKQKLLYNQSLGKSLFSWVIRYSIIRQRMSIAMVAENMYIGLRWHRESKVALMKTLNL